MKKINISIIAFLIALGAKANAQDFTCFSEQQPDEVFLRATLKGKGENYRITNIVVYEKNHMLTMKKVSIAQSLDLKPFYAFKNSIKFNSVFDINDKSFWDRVFDREYLPDSYLGNPVILFHMTDGVEFRSNSMIHNTVFLANKKELKEKRRFKVRFDAISEVKLICIKDVAGE